MVIAIVFIILGVIAVAGFAIAFFIELANGENEELPVVEDEPVISEQTQKEVKEEFDLDAMLARLEENAKQESAEKEEKVVPAMVEVNINNTKEAEPEKEAEVAEVEVSEVKKAEPKTTLVVIKEETHEVENNVVESKPEKTEPKQEIVDLSTRLESTTEAINKVEADLTKSVRQINKYERTDRRKARNQKLLDKKAEDLTKLNLVLYSVTDIKNIDADKKQKQEELTEHIAELKESIADAEKFLKDNLDKYQNAIKMKAFFEGEKVRLEADKAEILTLMGKKKTTKKTS